MEFEWDLRKAADNRRKHGVSFEEACEVFADPNAIEQFDAAHSRDEDRVIHIGFSRRPRALLVVYTMRHDEVIRIISARKATTAEAEEYGQAQD